MKNHEIYLLNCNQTLMIRGEGEPFRRTTWPEVLHGPLADVVSAQVGRVIPPGVGVVVKDSHGNTTTLQPGACASLLAHLLMQPKPNLLIDTRAEYAAGGGE